MQLVPHHVGIVVSDLDRSKRFYGALGFETVQEMSDEAKTICFMELANLRLELFCYVETPPSCAHTARTIGFRHFALRTDDLDATLAELRAADVVPADAAIREVEGRFRLLFFNDPDGVEIEIMQEG